MSNSRPPAEGSSYFKFCKVCDRTFTTWEAYHDHKVLSRKHITCPVCSIDFKHKDAFVTHHNLMHSKEQNLNCPGCSEHFTRVGALISHLELAQCMITQIMIPHFDFDASRKEKDKIYDNHRDVRNFQGYKRSAAGVRVIEEPMPLLPNYAEPPYSAEPPNQVAARASAYIKCDDDLIDLDAPTQALNAPWASSINSPCVPVARVDKFPGLPSVRGPKVPPIVGQPPAEVKNPWGTNRNLFSAAPAAVVPRVAMLSALSRPQTRAVDSKKPDPYEGISPLDPDHTDFTIGRYYVPFSKKYKCPHTSCKKSFDSENAFIAHLKSPAHRNEKLQCTNCLRYFSTATALTQHSESQGVRCKIRNTEEYSSEVDRFTAGTAVTHGRFEEDGTVRYVVNPELLPGAAQGIIDGNRAAHAAKDQEFLSYWERHNPKW